MSAPSRILIVKPSALGDIIQALPVATGLKRQWPEAQLDWIVNDTYRDLLIGHPSINNIHLYLRRRWTSPFRALEVWQWMKMLRSRQYDLVIDLQGLLRSGLMTWATQAPRRIGLKSAREGSTRFYNELVDDYPVSAAERYLCCLQYLGIEPDPVDFRYKASVPLRNDLQPLDGQYIALHPYSRWRTKLWPWRYYQELIDRMPNQPFVVLGEGPWFPLSGQNLIDLRSKLDLRQLLAVLEHARALVSTDSGPAHMAGALGTPTLVLFGATDPRRTRPVGRKVTVLTHDVFCAPCLKRSCYRDVPMECLTGISPEKVQNELVTFVP
jgi:heptosyltransferase I